MVEDNQKEEKRFIDKWSSFNGNPDNFNIAYECVDRHPKENIAIRIKFDDRRTEIYTFKELSRLTSQFANMLEKAGVAKGDQVGVMLPPSLEFYVSLFGTMKRGAILIPFSPLFGPEAIDFRLKDSGAKVMVISQEKRNLVDATQVKHLIVSEELKENLQMEDAYYETNTTAEDICLIQYSSGTTGIPKSVLYKHKAITVQAPLLEEFLKGENVFCPSSPSWGHGIWHGSIGPLIFGSPIGAYSFSVKFNVEILLEALEEFEVTSMAGATTIYRLIANVGDNINNYNLKLKKIYSTGEFMEEELKRFLIEKLGVQVTSSFGTAEIGTVLRNTTSDPDDPKLGSLGKPTPGSGVSILDEKGNELPPGKVGQIAIWRKGEWRRAGDAAYKDEDGYFWYGGRVDDVIISAGYTIGPDEIENIFRTHPAVSLSGVIGVPDKERGHVVKAIIELKPGYEPSEVLIEELKEYVKTHLSKHEYPRQIDFIEEMPRTADGKIKRNELRLREKTKS